MYELSKHRFLELKHHCLQYDEWADEWAMLDKALKTEGADPTGDIATRMAHIEQKAEVIDKTVLEAFGEDRFGIGHVAIRNGLTFQKHSPEYEMRRKFFWLLDKKL